MHSCNVGHGPRASLHPSAAHRRHCPPRPGEGSAANLSPRHPSPPQSRGALRQHPLVEAGKPAPQAVPRRAAPGRTPHPRARAALADPSEPFEAQVAPGRAGGISFGKAEAPPPSHALASVAGCSTPEGRGPVAHLPSKPSSAGARRNPEMTIESSSAYTAHCYLEFMTTYLVLPELP